tara:strand:- start:124 stop:720 length:597 start_codon:yes stop_codon:yes gene_type:complete
MGFIGKVPTPVPLTSSDITDGIITSAKIVDGTITSSDLASGVAGKVLQVVSATKTDTSSFTSSTFSDISGLSVSITPSSTSNKVLIVSYANMGWDYGLAKIGLKLLRGSTIINLGDANGSRIRMSSSCYINSNSASTLPGMSNFLDSPSTTSATTYKLQAASLDNAGTVYVNRPSDDFADNSTFATVTSTITAMEISA